MPSSCKEPEHRAKQSPPDPHQSTHPPLHVTLAEQLPSGAVQEHVSGVTAGEAEWVGANARTRKADVRSTALNFFIEVSPCELGASLRLDWPSFSASHRGTRLETAE
jgi:hypothetical protein